MLHPPVDRVDPVTPTVSSKSLYAVFCISSEEACVQVHTKRLLDPEDYSYGVISR